MRDVERRRAPEPEPAPEPPPPPASDPTPPAIVPAVRRPQPVARPQPRPIELSPGATPGLDRANAERLRRGDMPIEGRLDLHGLTQAQAHDALDGFLGLSHAIGRRCVLVITGKGSFGEESGRGRGILRDLLPRWLNEAPNRTRVLAFTQAQPRHGGGGAFYVLLKRQRSRA